MSDITGPVSTLPGSVHLVPTGAVCDQHPGRRAVSRIQGETDSFGSELIDCCEECRDNLRASFRRGRTGTCDWCQTSAADLRDQRDYEEGLCGRVYEVCGPCRKRYADQIAAELDGRCDERWT